MREYHSQDGITFAYDIVDADSLLMGGSTRSVFDSGSINYDYRAYLTRNQMQIRDNAVFDRMLVIPLASDYDNLLEAFSEYPDWIYHWSQATTWIIRLAIDELYGGTVGSDGQTEILSHVYGDTVIHSDMFRNDKILSRAFTNNYYHSQGNYLATLWRKTFNMLPWMWPDGVETRNVDGYVVEDYYRRELFKETDAAKFWKSFPVKAIGIPLLSDDFVQNVVQEDAEHLYHKLGARDIYYQEANTWKRCEQDSTYGNGSDYDHIKYYDAIAGAWKPKNGRDWGRTVRHCDYCNVKHNHHFLARVRSIGNWIRSRGTSDFACFWCLTLKATSYNANWETFVISEMTGDDYSAGIEASQYDYYRHYVHGKDTPARVSGTRTYMVNAITDESWVNRNNQDDSYLHKEEDLAIHARKYMSWVREQFQGNPNTTQLIQDLRQSYWLDYNESQRAAELLDDEEFVMSNGDELDSYGQLALQQSELPVVRLTKTTGTIANDMPMFLSLRIDYNQERHLRPSSVRSRSGRRERLDDGWLEPNHQLDSLNLVKNDYDYRPPFYYVTHTRRGWLACSTDMTTNRVDDDLACGCDECVHYEDTRAHIGSTEWHRRMGLHLGLELELVARDTRLWHQMPVDQLIERTIHTFHPNNYNSLGNNLPQMLYAKRDGSLPSDTGVEYISQPMTLQGWKHIPDMFWNLVEANYKAFGLEDVGIHIHIPWASFDKAHGYAFLSALNTMQIQRDHGLLGYVSQRLSGRWAAWDLLEYRDAHNTIAEVVKQRRASNSDKYKGINLLHSNTIELRYFKSNAKGSRVLKNLEFVDAIWSLTLEHVLATSGWNTTTDMPQIDLIDKVNEYGNLSSKYKTVGVHLDEQPAGQLIEKLIVDYVRVNNDKYPHLSEFLTPQEQDEEEDDSITLYDIGNYEMVEEENEPDSEPTALINVVFDYNADSVTIGDVTYANN